MFLIQVILAILVSAQLIQAGISVTLSAESDTSGSALGLLNPSSPSRFHYDDKTGLRLEGSYADVLGPPVKMADGFKHLVQGAGMFGLGQSLQSDGAIMNLDAKLMDGASVGSLIKGGLLLTGTAANINAANALAGAPGRKIASVLQFPVKVVAMKDIAASKALSELAKKEADQGQAERIKGAQLVQDGNALKHKGAQEILQGASEGVQNFGNMVTKTTNNAASAFRLLPILLDFPKFDQPSPAPQQQQQQVETKSGATGQSSPGLFGNFGSFLQPGASHTGASHGGLFSSGSLGGNSGFFGGNNGVLSGENGVKMGNGLAAVLNITHPIASLLTNPGVNPFILPMSAAGASIGGWNPIAQGLGHKQPIGTAGLSFGNDAKGQSIQPIQQQQQQTQSILTGPQQTQSILTGPLPQQQQQQQQQVQGAPQQQQSGQVVA